MHGLRNMFYFEWKNIYSRSICTVVARVYLPTSVRFFGKALFIVIKCKVLNVARSKSLKS